jgi:hypothetical protein
MVKEISGTEGQAGISIDLVGAAMEARNNGEIETDEDLQQVLDFAKTGDINGDGEIDMAEFSLYPDTQLSWRNRDFVSKLFISSCDDLTGTLLVGNAKQAEVKDLDVEKDIDKVKDIIFQDNGNDQVGVGDKVIVKYLDGQKKVYIIGEDNADIMKLLFLAKESLVNGRPWGWSSSFKQYCHDVGVIRAAALQIKESTASDKTEEEFYFTLMNNIHYKYYVNEETVKDLINITEEALKKIVARHYEKAEKYAETGEKDQDGKLKACKEIKIAEDMVEITSFELHHGIEGVSEYPFSCQLRDIDREKKIEEKARHNASDKQTTKQ